MVSRPPSEKTELPEVRLLKPDIYRDQRGFLLEAFDPDSLGKVAGLGPFTHITHSRSSRGTVRGLHFQLPRLQGKLVWVAHGKVFDVAVDVRRGSPSFGRWTAHELDDESHLRMWIPPGFAHGFCALSDEADVMYACTQHYLPGGQQIIRWDDPAIGIVWPLPDPTLSEKDAAAPLLAEASVLPDYEGS